MIPEAAVEAAARVTFEGLFDLDPDDGWEHLTPAEREPYERQARAVLEAAAPHMMTEVTKLIRDLTDPDDCTFDHHGGCQAHGYLDLKPGETCPQADAKGWAK